MKFGRAALETKMVENCEQSTDDDERTPEHGYTIS